MHQLTLEISSLEQLWDILEKQFPYVCVSNFSAYPFGKEKVNELFHNKYEAPNFKLKNLSVDLNTDLAGLRKILLTEPQQILFYQFSHEIDPYIDLGEHPADINLEPLVKKGLKYIFDCNWEMLTIYSNDLQKLNQMAEYITFEEELSQFKSEIDIR